MWGWVEVEVGEDGGDGAVGLVNGGGRGCHHVVGDWEGGGGWWGGGRVVEGREGLALEEVFHHLGWLHDARGEVFLWWWGDLGGGGFEHGWGCVGAVEAVVLAVGVGGWVGPGYGDGGVGLGGGGAGCLLDELVQ